MVAAINTIVAGGSSNNIYLGEFTWADLQVIYPNGSTLPVNAVVRVSPWGAYFTVNSSGTRWRPGAPEFKAARIKLEAKNLGILAQIVIAANSTKATSVYWETTETISRADPEWITIEN